MRAVMCHELGAPEMLRIEEVPDPEPGACHVRVSVEAAGVNFADTLIIQGRYQEKPPLPFTPGLEVAGRIDKVGAGVVGLEEGQAVIALVDRGGFAQKVIARADDVIPIPADVGMETAAGFAIAYGTAYGALAWRGALHRGESLLVHGAAGGVGLAAVECGKALGARVIATARGAEKLETARAHGAEEAFDSDDPEIVAKLKTCFGKNGVDVVYDPVGGSMFDASMRVIAWEGRIVIVGFASGEVPQIRSNILLVKNASAIGFYWGSYRRFDPARLRDGFETLFAWQRNDLIRPTVSRTLPLEECAAALRLLMTRKSIGKVVLTTR